MSASQVSGDGASRVCAGGPPHYCSRTDQAVQYVVMPTLAVHDPYDSGPPVGYVFTMPDFGERVMRVTNSRTYSSGGAAQIQQEFFTDSSDEFKAWSAFDPSIGASGGFRFGFLSGGGAGFIDIFDPSAMTITPYVSPNTGSISVRLPVFSWNDPNVGFDSTGSVGSNLGIAAYCLSTASPSDPWCQNGGIESATSNGQNPFVNFYTACPNLPTLTGNYFGIISASADDTKFSSYIGGATQQDTRTIIYYDKTSGTCRWFNTATGMEGGTGEANTPVTNALMPAPVTAPGVVANTTGGSLTSTGTTQYCVEDTVVSYVLDQSAGTRINSETTPSPETCVTMAATNNGSLSITLHASSNPNWLPYYSGGSSADNNNSAVPIWDVYIGTSSGGETLQKSFVDTSSATQSAALVAGAAPPATNSAGFSVHYAYMNRAGTAVAIVPDTLSNAYEFWWPLTNTLTVCNVACGGHDVVGYNDFVNGPNDYMSEMAVGTFANPSARGAVTTQPPAHDTDDSHWSWTDNLASDAVPVVAGIYHTDKVSNGNGTRNESPSPSVNPDLAVKVPYSREVIGIDPTSGTIYRFGHNPTGSAYNWASSNYTSQDFYATALGSVSQDGKWWLFASNWEWNLGSWISTCANAACAWSANTSFASGKQIVDSNGHLETSGGGTSGATVPTWPTTQGGTVADGTITWTMDQGCPNDDDCRIDVFLMELR